MTQAAVVADLSNIVVASDDDNGKRTEIGTDIG
jgi:hypothetical protein